MRKQRIQTRTIAGVTLICASFLSAYVLSSAANRTELFWSTKGPLTPGRQISLNDLVAQRIAIPAGSQAYVRANQNIGRYLVLRPVGAGELVPLHAITSDISSLRMSSVPLSVHGTDVPAELAAGEIVNLYHVGDPHVTSQVTQPELVLARAYILAVDRKGQNLGGDLTITLSVPTRSVLPLLEATAAGRIVVVRTNV